MTTPESTTPESNQAVFFTRPNFDGDSHRYSIDDGVVEVLGELNDRFKSVKVGDIAKVLAWQHYGFGGNYAEWDSDQPDISAIGGLSVFTVTYRTTRFIMARFENVTQTDRILAMKVNTAGADPGLSERWLMQNEPDFVPIALAFEDGRSVTTALYVQDQTTFIFSPTGSCYFRWNSGTNAIEMDPGANFPAGMTCKQASASEFVFEL